MRSRRRGSRKPGAVLHADAAPGEHPRQNVRHAVRLRDRRGDDGTRRVAALVPGAAEDGARDAEERPRLDGEG